MKNSLYKVEWTARIALAAIFVYFGVLKIVGVSPSEGLVEELLALTMPFIPFAGFIVFLGIVEVLIGFLFLFKRFTRSAFVIMLVQMFTTFGPLVFLPDAAWSAFLVPTLAGQYIIKNLALIALGYTVFTLNRHNEGK